MLGPTYPTSSEDLRSSGFDQFGEEQLSSEERGELTRSRVAEANDMPGAKFLLQVILPKHDKQLMLNVCVASGWCIPTNLPAYCGTSTCRRCQGGEETALSRELLWLVFPRFGALFECARVGSLRLPVHDPSGLPPREL